MDIELPYKFNPRKYQIPFFNSLDGKKKRAVVVCHRRWGKDKTALNLCIKKIPERVGLYFYIFPKYKQARKVIWNGIDKSGMKFIDHFPREIIKKKNKTEMSIDLKGGSIWQLIGSDNYDSIMGTNPVGCVFSEYSLQDPFAWDYIRPILDENGGWAIFIYTFRRKNHAWKLYQMAKNNPDWFCQMMTINDSKLDDGTPVITKAMVDKARAEGMDEDIIQEDYYCNPAAAARGSFYGKNIAASENAKPPRICSVPHLPDYLVDTWWDLGVGENMCIWFTQNVGAQIHIIDYVQGEGEGLPFFAKVLQDKKEYVYNNHYMPPDIDAPQIGTGKTLKATALALGISPIVNIKKMSVESGIHACRMIFPRCYFDAVKCERGINGLRDYHKKYDEKSKTYMPIPDPYQPARHPADAFRTFAVGHTFTGVGNSEPQTIYNSRKKGY